jgi:tRNA nucleotidyltransferase (CCA-adding enzyme)
MGGLGKQGEKGMYHWIEDKDFLNRMKSLCSDIVNQLVQAINSDGLMEVKQHLVGSGAKNLITQNANEPIDLDYNLEIIDSGDTNINDGRAIKNYVKEVFDSILIKAGWNPCQDSTSALTTDQRFFKKGNKTPFSIDICIIRVDRNGSWYRLIHQKTGIVQLDQYYWNEAPQSKGLTDRVEWLKDNDCWLEVRDAYLEKKNMYLTRNDRNHHSFNIYIEAVNEIYGKYNGGFGYVRSIF